MAWHTQLSCLVISIASILYFFRPQIAHRMLVIVSIVLALIVPMATQPAGFIFWVIVLLVLLQPSFSTTRNTSMQ